MENIKNELPKLLNSFSRNSKIITKKNNNEEQVLKMLDTLPIEDNTNNEYDLLEKLSLRTISYYEESLGIKLDSNFTIEDVDVITIDQESILIPLTNDMDGIVYMGISNNHGKELISQYLDKNTSKEEIEELIISNLAETLNVILGNILKDLNIMINGGIVGIKTPIVHNNTNITKHENSKIIISKLKYKDEYIQLGYFI